MLFGRRPVDDCKNTILVHSIRLTDSVLKKGHLLAASDISLLKKEGVESVIVAALQDGDIGEDEAAAMLAKEVSGAHLDIDKPFTGRCNIYSNCHGVLQINEEGINQINQVHESITIATLSNHVVVAKGQMLATVKIIPYGVSKRKLVDCLQIINQHLPVIQVSAFEAKNAGLIQSRLPGMRKAIFDKTSKVLSQRLEYLGGKLVKEDRCEHSEKPIAELLTQYLDEDLDIIIISSASAITDRRDVVPAAIVKSGGQMVHFGMPVDPGNLLLVANKDATPVIGMPGCARSPKLNGFDFILQRLLANIPISGKAIMSMGVGGLLKEIESRPQKREAKSRTTNT